MDACSLGNVPRVADLDTGLATSLLVRQTTVSLCLPGILTYGTLCTLPDCRAPAPRPSLSERLSNVTADRSGACRQSYHATTDLEMERSDVQAFPRASRPARTRQAESVGEPKVPGSCLESFCTREHETPKLQAGRSLARGPLEEVQHPVRGLANVIAACSCQSGRNTADILTLHAQYGK